MVFTGDTLKLEIDLAVTEDGVVYDLEYAWYDYAWQEGDEAQPIATGPKLEIPITVQKTVDAAVYYDVATLADGAFLIPYTVAVYRIIDGEAIYLRSYSSDVIIYPSSLQFLPVYWEIMMGNTGGNVAKAAISMVVASPILLVGILFSVPS